MPIARRPGRNFICIDDNSVRDTPRLDAARPDRPCPVIAPITASPQLSLAGQASPWRPGLPRSVPAGESSLSLYIRPDGLDVRLHLYRFGALSISQPNAGRANDRRRAHPSTSGPSSEQGSRTSRTFRATGDRVRRSWRREPTLLAREPARTSRVSSRRRRVGRQRQCPDVRQRSPKPRHQTTKRPSNP